MKNQKKKSFPRRVFLCLLAVLLAVCIAFGIYVSDYYHTEFPDWYIGGHSLGGAMAAWMNLQ